MRDGFAGAQEGNPVCFDPGWDAAAWGGGGEGVRAVEDCGCGCGCVSVGGGGLRGRGRGGGREGWCGWG